MEGLTSNPYLSISSDSIGEIVEKFVIPENDRVEFKKWFSEQPADSIPNDTPLERVYKFFQAFRQIKRQGEAESFMTKVSADVKVSIEEKAVMREQAAIKSLQEKDPMRVFKRAYDISHIGH